VHLRKDRLIASTGGKVTGVRSTRRAVAIAQLVLLHLAHRVARQFGDDVHGAGVLVAGQLRGDGCGDLDWWFNTALRPPPPNAKPAKPKPEMTLADMPRQCRAVANAPAMGSTGSMIAATSTRATAAAAGLPYAPSGSIPIPTNRPAR